MHRHSNFLQACQELLLSICLIIAILMSVKQYLMVLLICISLMVSDTEHLFMCLLAIYIPSLRNGYPSHLSIFKLGCLGFFAVIEFVPQILSYYIFILSPFNVIFKLTFRFPLWPMDYLEIYCLVSNCLEIFLLSSIMDFSLLPCSPWIYSVFLIF